MNANKLLLGFIMLMLCASSVSALSTGVTVRNNYPGWSVSGVPPAVTFSMAKTIDRNVWLSNPTVNFTVSGMTATWVGSSTYRYRVACYQMFDDASFPVNSTDATFSGDVVFGNGSGDHSYSVTLDTDEFLWDGMTYMLNISVRSIGFAPPGEMPINVYNLSYLSMTSPGASGEFVYLSDCDPPYFDLQGWRAVGRGVMFKATGLYFDNLTASWGAGALSKQNLQLTVLVTDNSTAHNLLGSSVCNIYYKENSSRETIGYSFSSSLLPAFTSHFGFLPFSFKSVGDLFHARSSYYVFIGVNYSVSSVIASDGTFMQSAFSIDNFYVGNDVYPNSHSSDPLHGTYKYAGVYTYFETFPRTGEGGGGWTPGSLPSSPIGVLIINFCNTPPPNGLGMPWFGVVLAFLPTIILMCALYSASIRFHASFPNFLYMIAAGAGMTISLGISLMELWMYVFMMVLLGLTMILNYREEINAVANLQGIITGKPVSMRNTGLVSKKSYKFRAHPSPYKDQGVKRKPEPDWIDKDTPVLVDEYTTSKMKKEV